MRRMIYFWICGLIGISLSLQAQEKSEFFNAFKTRTRVYGTNTWHMDLELEIKHLWGSEGWRRFGVRPRWIKPLGPWALEARVSGLYTFDQRIDNFWELRPTLGIKHRFFWQIFTVQQEFRGEYRHLYFQNRADEHYPRLFYNFGVEVPFPTPTEENVWEIVADVGWYFLKERKTGERYPNSRELSIGISRELSEGKHLELIWIREIFLRSMDKQARGNTIALTYRF